MIEANAGLPIPNIGKDQIADLPRILKWPPDHLAKPSLDKRGIQKGPNILPRSGGEVIAHMLKQHFNHNLEGIQRIFNTNIIEGSSGLTRDCFYRFIYHVCGYFRKEVINEMLQIYGLNDKEMIEFKDLCEVFQDPYTRRSQPKYTQPLEAKLVNEEKGSSYTREPTGPFALTCIKKKLFNNEITINDILPAACLAHRALIVPPQLREAFSTQGFDLSDSEFWGLWRRYDTENACAISREKLFRILNLDHNGKPRIPQLTRSITLPVNYPIKKQIHAPSMDLSISNKMNDANQSEINTSSSLRNSLDLTRENFPIDCVLNTRQSELVSTDYKHCRESDLHNLVDIINQRINEQHIALYKHIMRYAVNDVIELEYFLKALFDFGVNLTPEIAIEFLKLLNLNPDSINVTDFFTVISSKLEDYRKKIFHKKEHFCECCASDLITAKNVERYLVELLSSKFLDLIDAFRKCECDDDEVIELRKFCNTLENQLNISVDHNATEALKMHITLPNTSLVDYWRFIQLYVKRYNHQSRPPTDAKILGVSSRGDVVRSTGSCVQTPKTVDSPIGRLSRSLTVIPQFSQILRLLCRKGHHPISRKELGTILHKISIELSSMQINALWQNMGFDSDGTAPIPQLLEFFGGELGVQEHAGQVPLRKWVEMAKDKQRARKMIKFSKSKPAKPLVIERPTSKQIEEKKIQIKDILEKIRPQMTRRYHHIMALVHEIDDDGTSTVPIFAMKDALRRCKVELSEAELIAILQTFDLKKTGRFYYLKFLRYYIPPLVKKSIDPPLPVNALPIIQKLRPQLLKKHNNLRRAFIKHDRNRDGVLHNEEFLGVLKSNGIKLDDEDFYHLMSDIDKNMDGVLSYNEFLRYFLV